MTKLATIIIPLYKPSLSPLEKIAVQQCFNVLSAYHIIALKPYKLNLDNYDFKFDEVVSFDNDFFDGPAGYNKLMLSSIFYERFLSYKFMLIYQPDAFIFNDDLTYWCNQGYDYIGAPWLRAEYPSNFKKIKNQIRRFIHSKFNIKQPGTDLPTEMQFENQVGNGGLSLRNVKKFYDICISNKEKIDYYNSRDEHYFGEDVFWGIEANRNKKQLSIPNHEVAIHFSMHDNPDYGFKITKGKLPFGCHAWDRQLNFWRPIFENIGITI